MKIPVYFLVHTQNNRKFRWYKTLSGARIAQRAYNRQLGFHTRVLRTILDNQQEVEQCLDPKGNLVLATYGIEFAILDSELDRICE